MFGRGSAIFSITEIKSFYPDQWVAIAVAETDADGLASAGEVIVHNSDEQIVWSATRLGDADDPIYVFFTGARRKMNVIA
jgi:hypothetical protein